MLALVTLVVERGHVARLAYTVASGIGTAGDGAADADADLLALQLVDAVDVDLLQELAGLLNTLLQLLLDTRLDGEGLDGGVHAVELGELRQVGVELFAGFVAHGAFPLDTGAGDG